MFVPPYDFNKNGRAKKRIAQKAKNAMLFSKNRIDTAFKKGKYRGGPCNWRGGAAPIRSPPRVWDRMRSIRGIIGVR
jgi:hypothetical protein